MCVRIYVCVYYLCLVTDVECCSVHCGGKIPDVEKRTSPFSLDDGVGREVPLQAPEWSGGLHFSVYGNTAWAFREPTHVEYVKV